MASRRKNLGQYKESRHKVDGGWKVFIHAGKGGVLWEATHSSGKQRVGELPFISAKDALAGAKEALRGSTC